MARLPEGASVLIPRLCCRDVAAEIDFCVKTFAAENRLERPGPDGIAAHALLLIGSAMLMLESEWQQLPSRAPQVDASSPVVIYVYVEDANSTVERALANGARLLMPLADQFWGDRTAWVMDPAGHVWTIASRIEETTEHEREERWSTILKEQQSA